MPTRQALQQMAQHGGHYPKLQPPPIEKKKLRRRHAMSSVVELQCKNGCSPFFTVTNTHTYIHIYPHNSLRYYLLGNTKASSSFNYLIPIDPSPLPSISLSSLRIVWALLFCFFEEDSTHRSGSDGPIDGALLTHMTLWIILCVVLLRICHWLLLIHRHLLHLLLHHLWLLNISSSASSCRCGRRRRRCRSLLWLLSIVVRHLFFFFFVCVCCFSVVAFFFFQNFLNNGHSWGTAQLWLARKQRTEVSLSCPFHSFHGWSQHRFRFISKEHYYSP